MQFNGLFHHDTEKCLNYSPFVPWFLCGPQFVIKKWQNGVIFAKKCQKKTSETTWNLLLKISSLSAGYELDKW